jgi:hypothetical protein
LFVFKNSFERLNSTLSTDPLNLLKDLSFPINKYGFAQVSEVLAFSVTRKEDPSDLVLVQRDDFK